MRQLLGPTFGDHAIDVRAKLLPIGCEGRSDFVSGINVDDLDFAHRMVDKERNGVTPDHLHAHGVSASMVIS